MPTWAWPGCVVITGAAFSRSSSPTLCWTVIYVLYLLPTAHYASLAAALKHLAAMAYTGYYQLYFLLVIMQFYLVFPLVLMLLRRTRGHHGRLIAAAALAQVTVEILMNTQILPPLTVRYGQQDALSYLLYLIGGGVVAFHLHEVHAWVCGHARLIGALTAAAALAAEGVYFLAEHGVTTMLGSGSDPFQPSVIPFNVGAITCGYLAGVALVRPGRSRRTKAVVRSGSDNAYGIYLSQMLFITALTWLGWGHLTSTIPWPLLCLLTVAIVFSCCVTLTSVLARTPLAVPLTGRKQQPWSTLMPRRRALDQIYPERARAEQARGSPGSTRFPRSSPCWPWILQRSRPPDVSASSVRPPLRCRFGAQTVRGGVRRPRHRDLRHDGGGQHHHRQPARRPAQGRLGGPASRSRGPGSPAGRRAVRAVPGHGRACISSDGSSKRARDVARRPATRVHVAGTARRGGRRRPRSGSARRSPPGDADLSGGR